MAKKIQVRLIMQQRAAGMSQTAIARERQMSKSSVSDVFQIAEERNISYANQENKTPDEVYRLFYPDKHHEETVYAMDILIYFPFLFIFLRPAKFCPGVFRCKYSHTLSF